jgi:hypothetical protein
MADLETRHVKSFKMVMGDGRGSNRSRHEDGSHSSSTTCLLAERVTHIESREEKRILWEVLEAALAGDFAVIDFEGVGGSIFSIDHSICAYLSDARARGCEPCGLRHLPEGAVSRISTACELDGTLPLLRSALDAAI